MFKTSTPRKPIGNTPKWYFMRWVWELLAGGQFPIAGLSTPAGTVKVEHSNGRYEVSLEKVKTPTVIPQPFPFEIYAQADDGDDPADPATARKFRVRAAKVQVVVSGDTGYLEDFAGNEAGPSIAVPDATAEYFIWFEVDATTHAITLDHSEVEPTWDQHRYLIGIVDTSGDAPTVSVQLLNYHQTIFVCS